jgi:hypothetical protein
MMIDHEISVSSLNSRTRPYFYPWSVPYKTPSMAMAPLCNRGTALTLVITAEKSEKSDSLHVVISLSHLFIQKTFWFEKC